MYKLKDVYVCFVGFQSKVKEECVDLFETNYSWKYSHPDIFLCIKTLNGYKRILTNQVYKKGSRKTGLQDVVVNALPWLKYDEEFAKASTKAGVIEIGIDLIESAESKYRRIFQQQYEEKSNKGL